MCIINIIFTSYIIRNQVVKLIFAEGYNGKIMFNLNKTGEKLKVF